MLNGLPSAQISDKEFSLFRSLFYDIIGLHLTEQKKQLLTGRLSKRLVALGLPTFKAYFDLITSPQGETERQYAVDLITTHETYFFREPQHFEILREHVIPEHQGPHPLRIWSAACSSGEEPYSLAMLLHDVWGNNGWEIQASDISRQVITTAQQALYLLEQARLMPQQYLKRYCLRGTGQYEGYLLVERCLRERVRFQQINLMQVPADMAGQDVIFLRNVAIYFDSLTRQRVLDTMARSLKPNGWLFLGHSESLLGGEYGLVQVAPSVYRKQAVAYRLPTANPRYSEFQRDGVALNHRV